MGKWIDSFRKKRYTYDLWKPTTLPFAGGGGKTDGCLQSRIGGLEVSIKPCGKFSPKEADTVLLSDIGSIASIVGLILTIVFEIRNRKK